MPISISNISRSTFEDLPQLKQLSLSNNYLKSLDKDVFSNLLSLEILILDHNQLEDINGMVTGLGSLKYLSLVHNHVKWFDVAFFPKSVQSINLAHNNIEGGTQFRLQSINPEPILTSDLFLIFSFFENVPDKGVSYYTSEECVSNIGNWELLRNVGRFLFNFFGRQPQPRAGSQGQDIRGEQIIYKTNIHIYLIKPTLHFTSFYLLL